MNYRWGSKTALSELLGVENPSREPQAEIWMGAHPKAPSKVVGAGETRSLLALIQGDPRGQLGKAVWDKFGRQLPFLFKVLAAAEPLSLQSHPNRAQARLGFQREQAQGVPLDSPARNYKDQNHKPELFCALLPSQALCGFRRVDETLRLFELLKLEALAPQLSDLRRQPTSTGLQHFVAKILTAPRSEQLVMLEACTRACELPQAGFLNERRWAGRLARAYPGDVGVIVSLLLNWVKLRPGEAIFLQPGKLHAYLQGTGLELMANSDNVLRGGLTPKHIDVGELLSILDFEGTGVSKIPPQPVSELEQVYPAPAEEFRLSKVALVQGARHEAKRRAPSVLLCTEGEVEVRCESDRAQLSRGQSLFVPARQFNYSVTGEGTVFTATTGLQSSNTDPVDAQRIRD